MESGLEFEFNGRRFRVVEPNHKGLRSYFSYEAVEPLTKAEPPELPGLKLIYAGPLAGLMAKPVWPPEVPPYLRDILAAMRPDPSPKTDEEAEAEGCPCGCGATDPDFEEVAESAAVKDPFDIRIDSIERAVSSGGPSCTINIRGTTASYRDEAAAVVAAIASHFGVAAPATDENAWSRLRAANVFLSEKVARLEAENRRLSGLYNNAEYQRGVYSDRAVKLEKIIDRFYIDACEAYKDAEIIPF
jgi:hypothetical protein